jgi:energy-converting hydrogenase Eha subunit A
LTFEKQSIHPHRFSGDHLNTRLVDGPENSRCMTSAEPDIKPVLHAGQRIHTVMALVFLPWIAVVLFTAGGVAALNFLAYAIVVLTAGYGFAFVALPAPARIRVVFLAPAIGILVISALTAFWVRLGNPLIWATALWFVLSVVGVVGLWKDRILWAERTVSYGLTLAVFSLLISMIYFLPSASKDAVQRRDGSYSWMFKDTQHFHAIAASIKDGGSPPKTPGTFTAELLYHFAPYAPAATISKLDGLDLGDALARVTRGASLWALLLSCFGLGTLLSIRATGKEFGGIMSVAGLFFYGSLLTLFTPEWDGSGHMIHPVLFTIPGVEVPGFGGPFGYLLSGHSLIHGLVAIAAVLGLCLIERERESTLSWRGAVLLALPALAVPVNSVAALYCLGVAGILLFWGRLATMRSWPPIILMLCLFLAAWETMGYTHAQDAAQASINHHVTWQWWPLAVWFLVGLGFRILGFGWISRSWKDPVSATVLASVVGLLAFSVLLQLRDGNERYGINFLQSIFSIFAFSRVTAGFWRSAERSKLIVEWLRAAKVGLTIITAAGVLIACVAFLTHHKTGTAMMGLKLLLAIVLLSLLVLTSALMNRSGRFRAVCSAVFIAVLMVGFLAWIPDLLRHGMGEVKTDVTYPPDEVHGLRRLGKLMAPDERFATNRHAFDPTGLQPPVDRSYGYSALAEHPVLLEGYLDRGENLLPWFSDLLRDNDLLFTATDPKTVRDIAQKWRVQWLVARPGTDISLPRPLPAWLAELQDTGSLKIYRIDNSVSQ